MTYKQCLKTLKLSIHDNVFAFLGIHPVHVCGKKFRKEHLDLIEALLKGNRNRINGIGEIGLDKYFSLKNFQLQEEVFNFFLKIAEKYKLGVTIHGKNAEFEVFEILKNFSVSPIAVHWYSGPMECLRTGIDRGYYFSFTPTIMTSPKHKRVVENVPLEKILTETDGPYKYKDLAGNRTIEAIPSMIPDLVKEISRIKNIEVEKCRSQLARNALVFLK